MTKLYTKKEAAELLQVSRANLDKIIKRDGIPVIKLGTTAKAGVRISEDDLNNWLDFAKNRKNRELTH